MKLNLPKSKPKNSRSEKFILALIGVMVVMLVLLCATGAGTMLYVRKHSPSADPTLAKEIQKRKNFAEAEEDEMRKLGRVLVNVEGKNSEILMVSVIGEVPPYQADSVVEMLIGNDLKRRAKEVGFVEIRIKGGKKDWTHPATIDNVFSLK